MKRFIFLLETDFLFIITLNPESSQVLLFGDLFFFNVFALGVLFLGNGFNFLFFLGNFSFVLTGDLINWQLLLQLLLLFITYILSLPLFGFILFAILGLKFEDFLLT